MLQKKLWQKLNLKSKKLLNQFLKINNWPKYSLLGLLFIYPFNIHSNLINRNVTKFSWVPDTEKPFSGKCYEYDIETGGKAFQAVVSKSKCKPEQTTYHWVPSERGVGGKCFEVDLETKGSKYASISSASNCVTENVSYVWEQTSQMSGECYQIDGNLKKKTSKNLCSKNKVDHYWVARENGWGGKCYAVDSVNGPAGYIESVKAQNCRPEQVFYKLNMKKEGTQGYCYEVALDGGERAYSRRVSREECFTNRSPEYMWQRDESGVGGECLEVRKSVNARVSSRRVDFKNCIDFKTEYSFRRSSKVEGVCLLVDSLTQGEKFSVGVVKRNCREQVKDLQTTLMQGLDGSPICVESDVQTGGSKYVSRVANKFCEDVQKKPTWILDESGWSGKCVERRSLGSIERDKLINKELCRPESTKAVWHNFSKLKGRCFDVDSKQGPSGFVKETSLKDCAPKRYKYIFYRHKDETAGSCYLVDRETSGEKFNKVVGLKKCRENLYKVPD
ncbi:hypothetical protein [Halobacteriovorax marinus]|uniref:hypothetical protein n=1 Tax=Halobacteriovorax marinus TaxID=97084 RepID=UPI003A8E15A5